MRINFKYNSIIRFNIIYKREKKIRYVRQGNKVLVSELFNYRYSMNLNNIYFKKIS